MIYLYTMMCFHSKISLLEGKCLVDMIIQRSNVGAIIPAPREGFPQNASCSLLWNPCVRSPQQKYHQQNHLTNLGLRACHQIGIPTSPPFLCLYLYVCIYIYIHMVHMVGPKKKPTILYVLDSLVGSTGAAIHLIYMYAYIHHFVRFSSDQAPS